MWVIRLSNWNMSYNWSGLSDWSDRLMKTHRISGSYSSRMYFFAESSHGKRCRNALY